MRDLTVAINQLTQALNAVNQTLLTFGSQTDSIKALPDAQPVAKTDNPHLLSKPSKLNDHHCEIPRAIADWFRKYQLGFDHINTSYCETESSRKLAMTMARHYAYCHTLISLLNLMSSGQKMIRLNLKDESVSVIGHTCAVANYLNKCGFLQYHQYKKSPQCLLTLRTNGLPATQAYLKGRWLEQAVDMLLCSVETSYKGLKWVKNVVVRTAKGQLREIDFIVSLNGQVFLLEATCGPWQAKATQVLSLANMLQLPLSRCVIISPSEHVEQMDEFSQLHRCHVVSFSGISRWFDEMSKAGQALPPENSIIDVESSVL